jgi:integrase
VDQALAIYGEEHALDVVDSERIAHAIDALVAFWADMPVSTISGATCRRYAKSRVVYAGTKHERPAAANTVRRELGCLEAALRYCVREGYLTQAPKVALPAKGEAKERSLTRNEVAALIRAARACPTKDSPKSKSRHLAWFILAGVYTGTRKEAILNTRLGHQTKGGWIDTATGTYHRKGVEERTTKKRRAPAKLPRKFLGHVRRLEANGKIWLVEYDGARVGSIKTSWATVRRNAGLGRDVTPHTLKHTAITWAMQSGMKLAVASNYFSTSIETLERVYYHHHPEFQNEAVELMNGRIGGVSG